MIAPADGWDAGAARPVSCRASSTEDLSESAKGSSQVFASKNAAPTPGAGAQAFKKMAPDDSCVVCLSQPGVPCRWRKPTKASQEGPHQGARTHVLYRTKEDFA